MISVATGFEKSSYSLQYVQDKLQRRMGMMWAITGWSVDATPRTIIRHSRARRFSARRSLQNLNPLVLMEPVTSIESYSCNIGYRFRIEWGWREAGRGEFRIQNTEWPGARLSALDSDF